MTYQEANLPNVENIGSVDRVHRIIAGVALISVAVMFTALPEAAIAGIVALGAYLGLTAFIGWDPLYAVVKAFLHPTLMPLAATVAPHQRQDQQLYADGYKQAA
jgi:hypothetical protein